jgi:predicted HicB family RNase H-like nuclease
MHFRIRRSVADALDKAAAAEQRTVSAWVAICVEDRLRGGGYLT